MNILIAINDKYFEPVVIMLNSLYKNNSEYLDIYLLYSSLTKRNIDKLDKIVKEKFKGSLYPIYVDSKIFENSPLGNHFTVEIYFRIIAPKLLPEKLDRVLWLDADMIILNRINDFYSQDFEEKLLIVSPDCCENTNIEYASKTKERLNLSQKHIYFNSGLILYNLKEIRKGLDYYTDVKIIESNKENLKMPDQDILNILYSNKVKYADNSLYNVQIRWDSEVDYNIIQGKAKIIHYIGRIKPWNLRWKNKTNNLFWNYSIGLKGYYKKRLYMVLNPLVNLSEHYFKSFFKK